MSDQKNIWDYYSICKKKLERLHAKKLRKSLNENVDTKSTIKANSDRNSLVLELNERNENSKNQSKQSKHRIDNETRQIILKSNTIIDQAKSPVKKPNYLDDDFIFKKPNCASAPKAKRKLSLDQKSLSDSKIKKPLDFETRSLPEIESQQTILNNPVNNENLIKLTDDFKIKKRLFDVNLDDLKTKVTTKSTDEFLNKLKDFQEKTSFSNSRFNISFYSPTKRAKEQLKQQEENNLNKKDMTNYSPKKYLESRLANRSPIKSPSQSTSETNLNLPEKYLELLKMFYYLDKVVANLTSQSVICTFKKVKLEIYKQIDRELNLGHLAQILYIFPGTFLLTHNNQNSSNEIDHLIIKRILQSNKFSAEYSIKIRVIEFKYRILKFVKKEYFDFLVNLKGSKFDGQELKRWHPDFKFPNVPEAKLTGLPVSEESSLDKEQFLCEDEIEVIFSDEEYIYD